MRLLNAARQWFWIAPAILGIVFIAGGVYTFVQGQDARDEVRDAIVRENITTSKDASIPNQRVDDADTAKAQAQVIEKHVQEITGGKTYAELPKDDPNRPTVLNSVTLRTALNMAVMGFNVSDLVTGLGAFLVVIGVTHILFLAPTVYWSAQVANQYAEGRNRSAGL